MTVGGEMEIRPGQGVYSPLPTRGSFRRVPAYLPLRLGGTRQDPWMPGVVRPGSNWAQQRRAVNRADARKANVVIPTLEEYEKKLTATDNVILRMPAAA
jgi:hypothetical protein